MLSIKKLIEQETQRIENCKIPDALFNVKCMVAKLLGCEFNELYFEQGKEAGPELVAELKEMVDRRCGHEPLQYIIREWSFLDFTLRVGPEALIPRPETEEMVVEAIELIRQKVVPRAGESFFFADIGTGTGAIGIAVARQFGAARGWLGDVSAEALELAGRNLSTFPQIKNVCTIKSDLLTEFEPNSLDIVLSNPPYIKKSDLAGLMPEVRQFEPWLALDGGDDGLDLIRRLITQAEQVLKPEGILIFEHGAGQQEEILSMFAKACWGAPTGKRDIYGVDRYVFAQKNGF